MPAEGGLVRLARAEETDVVHAIAVAAGRRFAAVAERRLWVAEGDGVAVGFLLAIDLPASVHMV